MSVFARVLGALTTAYGVAVVVRPSVLTGPTGLGPRHGDPSPPVATLARAVGVRDAVSGLAVAFAPRGAAMQVALAVRVAADIGDAVTLGVALSDRDAARRTIAVAGGWAALNALALATA
ncbi:hypothetical protein [Pseudonocardia sp. N23]|uniref:hypothetical protein n=1 Tax=Pseudonocardia sp. N23 TaxID=1987376 RepID=UPI000BFE4812|nr:hypothetical protein [Pseudonocardia sp. N23]GAY10817.1 hypothetical protein TOK_5179 [Pseudonocardia sp. N23]